ncbi:MAG: hypothetical protein K0Q59_727 [Paenibacillus sp.]|nr:hypothetical protein [Paenibacillus sp.]
MTTIRVTLSNELSELEKLRLFLTEAAKSFTLNEREMYMLNLICDEWVTNIISYGYGEGAEIKPRIDIVLTKQADRVTVSFSDDGVAFNPLTRADPDVHASIDDRRIGGLGIHFVKTLTDEARYERLGERNLLQLTLIRRKQANIDEERNG